MQIMDIDWFKMQSSTEERKFEKPKQNQIRTKENQEICNQTSRKKKWNDLLGISHALESDIWSPNNSS